MPYIEAENKILTKVLGVANRVFTDLVLGQEVLFAMLKNPERVDEMYTNKTDVHVLMNDSDFHIGYIKDEYLPIISKYSASRIKKWMITGGKRLENSKQRQHLGINLEIELIP